MIGKVDTMIYDNRNNARLDHNDHISSRFDSDRESLPFPVGGVFGPIRKGEPTDIVWNSEDVVAGIDRVIDQMQHQLDELETDVEAVIASIGNQADGDDWRPSAA